jgi:hypothetical protein
VTEFPQQTRSMTGGGQRRSGRHRTPLPTPAGPDVHGPLRWIAGQHGPNRREIRTRRHLVEQHQVGIDRAEDRAERLRIRREAPGDVPHQHAKFGLRRAIEA